MPTLWQYRINIIAPSSDVTAINALWTIIAPEGDSEANTFGVPLSATGDEPATHYGISTAATEDMRIAIIDTYAAELAGCAISIQPYTENDYEELLAAQGLQPIRREVI